MEEFELRTKGVGWEITTIHNHKHHRNSNNSSEDDDDDCDFDCVDERKQRKKKKNNNNKKKLVLNGLFHSFSRTVLSSPSSSLKNGNTTTTTTTTENNNNNKNENSLDRSVLYDIQRTNGTTTTTTTMTTKKKTKKKEKEKKDDERFENLREEKEELVAVEQEVEEVVVDHVDDDNNNNNINNDDNNNNDNNNSERRRGTIVEQPHQQQSNKRRFNLYSESDDDFAAKSVRPELRRETEEDRRTARITTPIATVSYANMRKDSALRTIQITTAFGSNYSVCPTKGWNTPVAKNTTTTPTTGTTAAAATTTRLAVPETISPGIFFTKANGGALPLKNIDSLAKARALLRNNSDDNDAKFPARIEQKQQSYLTPLNIKNTSTPKSTSAAMFSTGLGKAMHFSEASLQKGRSIFESNEDSSNKSPICNEAMNNKASTQTMSEIRPKPGFPRDDNDTILRKIPDSAPSRGAAHDVNHHPNVHQQKQYNQNLSRMNPEHYQQQQHHQRVAGAMSDFRQSNVNTATKKINAFTPPSMRAMVQKQKQTAINHLPTHDLFKSRTQRESLAKFFNGARPFESMNGDQTQNGIVVADIFSSKMTFDNAQEHRISIPRANILKMTSTTNASLTLGWRDIRDLMFARGAKEKILTEEWCANAYRHVVWTAASIKRAFNFENCTKQALTSKYILERMMYKYEREINLLQRPIIRKILERDAPSSVPMILLVSAIRSFGVLECDEENDEREEKKRGDNNEKEFFYAAEIELSDGWYSIRAVLDDALSSHLRENRIRIGSKMFVQNCSMNGVPDGAGVQPLKPEAYQARLLLSSNSCRPVKWDAKLGLQKTNLTIPLSSVRSDGGEVPRVLFTIHRHLPPVYRERLIAHDGTALATVNRREESEIAKRQEFEMTQQKVIETALNKDSRENEVDDQRSYEEALKINRAGIFEKERERRREEVKSSALEEAGIPETRKVSRTCRFLAIGMISKNANITTANRFEEAFVITVWETDENFRSSLEEGSVYAATHLKVSESKDFSTAARRSLNLCATKKTHWLKISPEKLRYSSLRTISEIDSNILFSESNFDCVAIHLYNGSKGSDGCRFFQWMFFLEIREDGSCNFGQLFALRITSRDENELECNFKRWSNICDKSAFRCVVLRNMAFDGIDQVHCVKNCCSDIDLIEMIPFPAAAAGSSSSSSMNNMLQSKMRHLFDRFEKFKNADSLEVREHVEKMKNRAYNLANNKVENIEPTLSQFTPPRVHFDDDDEEEEEENRGRSSIRFSDSGDWGGSQWNLLDAHHNQK